MLVKTLRFKAGSTPGAPPLTLATTAVTVFVGPNYSGKSQAVAEIANCLKNGSGPQSNLVLEEIELQGMSESEADATIASMRVKPRINEVLHQGHELYGFRQDRFQTPESKFKDTLMNPKSRHHNFTQWYSRFKTLSLDGASRIGLIRDQSAGDMQNPPHSSFQTLFRDDALRSRLSHIIFNSFGLYLTVDPTNVGKLRLRLSPTPPPSPNIERGLTEESINFHGHATLIDDTSDGAKAFVGILCEILAGDPSVLLIDEPEAFLHPSLAFKLGHEISKELSGSKKQMFASTHSANFIMGCIQSGADVNIVRLTYRDKNATARLLPSPDLRKLMRNPLLRSTNVLNALFHESVIVTEGDSDRAFYQEINERLLAEGRGRGIQNAIFLNAQNKQTIPTIITPLRKLGIPAAAIYDIDVIKDGGRTSRSLLSSAGVPEIFIHPLNIARSRIHEALKIKNDNFKKDGGIYILEDPEKEAAESLLFQLQKYGIFVTPRGELESWLEVLGVSSGHGPTWLIPIFEKLGEDPSDEMYVHPSEGDVWAFMDTIRRWLHDPDRKGIPS